MRIVLPNRLLTCAAAACLALTCGAVRGLADEPLRHAQQALHDQGFYYGAVDGAPSDETTQAIRRYQIRNGLAVTGQLNDETSKSIGHGQATALNSGSAGANSSADRAYAEGTNATPPPLHLDAEASAPPAATPAASPPAFRSLPHPDPGVAPAQTPTAIRPAPRGPAIPGREPPGAMPPSPELTSLFEGTPYEFAPPPVQAETLRRAQAALLRNGFYDGVADGVPGSQTTEALSNLQEVSRVRATGRLDARTLAILHLLPPGQAQSRRPGPGGVYEGRIVR